MNRKYYESIDFLKVLLLSCTIINTYTLISMTGVPVLPLLSFAIGTFFLLYGYFVLRPGEDILERIKRGIRHTAIAFAVSAVVYFALLCVSMLITGDSVASLFTKKSIFDFFVLNDWYPYLGGNIWIIQSLLYALIIFYFMEKWNLLRYDLHIMILLFVVAILIGEGAGLIRFHIGNLYNHIPGMFLTRTMPYMLLGRVIYKARFKRDFGKIKNWMWVCIFFVGIALSFIEVIGLINSRNLVYLNHMIGFIPMSVAISMIFLNMKRKFRFGKYYRDIGIAGYYIYSVVAQAAILIFSKAFPNSFGRIMAYMGIITLVLTMLLSILYARFRQRQGETPNESPEKGESGNETQV